MLSGKESKDAQVYQEKDIEQAVSKVKNNKTYIPVWMLDKVNGMMILCAK